uniref:Uncharacterized protein n=1 Tax=Anguilla anguilla TaxID=7936 RepID=A0A0E9R611_ANGAN
MLCVCCADHFAPVLKSQEWVETGCHARRVW